MKNETQDCQWNTESHECCSRPVEQRTRVERSNRESRRGDTGGNLTAKGIQRPSFPSTWTAKEIKQDEKSHICNSGVVCPQLLKSKKLSKVMEAGLKTWGNRGWTSCPFRRNVPCLQWCRNKTLAQQNQTAPPKFKISKARQLVLSPLPLSSEPPEKEQVAREMTLITGSGRKHNQTYIVLFGRLSAVLGFLRRND